MTNIINAIVCIVSFACSAYCWYRIGLRNGRSDTISQLFAGEKDFYMYLSWRMTGGKDAEILRKLVACLRDDYNIVAEWDGMLYRWNIEVMSIEG